MTDPRATDDISFDPTMAKANSGNSFESARNLPPALERLTPGTADFLLEIEHVARYQYAANLIGEGRVLDNGCGTGYGSAILARAGLQVVGVDISSQAIEHCWRTYSDLGVEFYQTDSSELFFPDDFFKAVVSFEVIEHIAGYEKYIEEAHRVLCPGGLLILSTPNRFLYSDVRGITNPFHVHEFNPDELQGLLQRFFPEVQLLGQVYVPSLLIGLPSNDDQSFRANTPHVSSSRHLPLASFLARSEYLIAICHKAGGSETAPVSGPSHSFVLPEYVGLPMPMLQASLAAKDKALTDLGERSDQLQSLLVANEETLERSRKQLDQQTQLARSAMIQSLEKRDFIRGLKTQIRDLTQLAQSLSHELEEAEGRRDTAATKELEAIHNAKFWRAMGAYWRVHHTVLSPYRAFREWLRRSIPHETRRAMLNLLGRKPSVPAPIPVVQPAAKLTSEEQRSLTSLLRKLKLEVNAADLVGALPALMTEPDWANLRSLLAHLQPVSSSSDAITIVDGADLPPSLTALSPLTILVISGEFPNPLHGGGWRVYDYIKTLGTGNKIFLYAWYQPDRDRAALEDLRPYCQRIEGVSLSEFGTGFASFIKQLVGRIPFDIVNYEWPRSLLNYTGDRRAKHVFTFMEVTSLRLRMDMEFESTLSPRWTQKMVDLINALKVELVDAAKMDARIVLAHRDGAFLADLDARQNYVVINTGIKIDDFCLPDCEPEPKTLVFVGNYLHYPNEDAVKYFFNCVYPTVRDRIPGTKVLIVGEGPTDSVKAFHDGTNVIVTGKVDDIRPYIQSATVCLAPLITGAGYRGKIHQYSALRRVCVATSNAVVDMAYQDGKDIFVTDDPGQFADRIIYLLEHPAIARQMGEAAFTTVCARHSHQRAIDQTYRLYQQLLNSAA